MVHFDEPLDKIIKNVCAGGNTRIIFYLYLTLTFPEMATAFIENRRTEFYRKRYPGQTTTTTKTSSANKQQHNNCVSRVWSHNQTNYRRRVLRPTLEVLATSPKYLMNIALELAMFYTKIRSKQAVGSTSIIGGGCLSRYPWLPGPG